MWKNLIINSYFQTEIIYIGLLLLFATILTSIILILANIFGPSTPDVEKVAAYECGFDPYEDARHAFDVHFYLVSMLFIVFDLEAAFFYPWCVSLNCLTNTAYWGMTDFIIELFVGYIYAFEVGALNWE